MLNLESTSEKEIAVDRGMEKDNITTIMEICMMDAGREIKSMVLDATHSVMEECKLLLISSLHSENHPRRSAHKNVHI